MTAPQVGPARRIATASLGELLDMRIEDQDLDYLVGTGQHLVRAIRQAVRDGDVDALTEAHREVTERHEEVPESANGRITTGALGAPYRRRESAFAHALRAVAALGLALVVDDDGQARGYLTSAEQWLAVSGICLPAEDADGGVAGQADVDALLDTLAIPKHHRIGRLTGPETLRDPVRLTAWLWLLHLAGRLPASRPGPSCGVLFDLGHDGLRGILSLATIPGLPPVLAPNPETMLLVSADDAFHRMLGDVWVISARFPGVVLWSVEEKKRPVLRISGPSIGGAFAILYRELRRRRLPVPRLVRRPRTLIVGAVSRMRSDRLCPVEGYPGKLDVVGRWDRLIVPAEDAETVRTIARSTNLAADVLGRRTLDGAARKSRQPQRHHQFLAALCAALLVGIAATGYQGLLRYQTSRNLDRSEVNNAAKALQDRAAVLRDSYPATALRLAAAAVALDPSNPAVHANLVDLVTTTRYRNTLRPGDPPVSVENIQLSTDGTVMLTTGETGAVLWTGDNGRAFTLRGRLPKAAWDVPALRPDGRLVALRSTDGIHLFDVTDPDRPRESGTIGTGTPAPLSFSQDGKLLLSANSPPRVWTVTDPAHPVLAGKAPRAEDDGSSPVASPVACPGGMFAVAVSSTVRLYRVTGSAPPRLLGEVGEVGGEIVVALACTEDGLLITGTAPQIGVGDTDGTVTAWDVTDPAKPVRSAVFEGHRGGVEGLAVRGDHLAAVGDSGARIARMQPAGERQIEFTDITTVAGRGGAAIAPDRRTLFTGLADETGPGIGVWDIGDLTDPDVTVYEDAPFAMSTAFVGDLLATAHDNYEPEVVLFRATPDGRLTRLSTVKLGRASGDGVVPQVVLSPDRRTLAATLADGDVGLWRLDDPAHPRPVHTLPVGAQPRALLFTHDPQVLVTIDAEGEAAVWDVADARAPRRTAVLPAAPVPTGPDVPAAPVPTGPEAPAEPDEYQAGWTVVAVSAAAPVMATASDDGTALTLWNTRDPRHPKQAAALHLPSTRAADGPRTVEGPLVLALSADGTRMITNDGAAGLKLWQIREGDTPTGTAISSMTEVKEAVFGPQANLVATNGRFAVTQLWDLADPRHPVALRSLVTGSPGHSHLTAVRFTEAGDAIYYASEELYRLPTAEQARLSADPLGYTCAIVGHGPSRTEWAALAPEVEWREVCR